MLRFMVVKEETTDKFYPTVYFGPQQVWMGRAEDEPDIAHEVGQRHVSGVFMNLFLLSEQAILAEDLMLRLHQLDPSKIQTEALQRESFGGKSFTENVLDIVKEALSAT